MSRRDDQRCRDCRWYSRQGTAHDCLGEWYDDEEIGECHGWPPVCGDDGSRLATFPYVFEFDWCRMWEEKDETP